MQFRNKPVLVDAEVWTKNGDHSADAGETFTGSDGKPIQGEGKVVRYYRRPDDDGARACEHCSRTMGEHGWIDTLEGGHIVCPGDWIITGVKGERYPCKPDVFAATYEPLLDATITMPRRTISQWLQDLWTRWKVWRFERRAVYARIQRSCGHEEAGMFLPEWIEIRRYSPCPECRFYATMRESREKRPL